MDNTNPMRCITKLKNGRFKIVKYKSGCNFYLGTYDTVDKAIKIRDFVEKFFEKNVDITINEDELMKMIQEKFGDNRDPKRGISDGRNGKQLINIYVPNERKGVYISTLDTFEEATAVRDFIEDLIKQNYNISKREIVDRVKEKFGVRKRKTKRSPIRNIREVDNGKYHVKIHIKKETEATYLCIANTLDEAIKIRDYAENLVKENPDIEKEELVGIVHTDLKIVKPKNNNNPLRNIHKSENGKYIAYVYIPVQKYAAYIGMCDTAEEAIKIRDYAENLVQENYNISTDEILNQSKKKIRCKKKK